MLTIGIPSKGINFPLLKTIERVRCISEATEIIVSINPGDKGQYSLAEFIDDARLKIIYQERDLGLYGNFRYLANVATNPYFIWNCTDDLISKDLQYMIDAAESKKLDLVIPNWEMREFHPSTSTWEDSFIEGRLPQVVSGAFRIHDVVDTEPSWIFGLWRTEFLIKHFPQRNFDWLDTTLLQAAFLKGKVSCTQDVSPNIIGTWNWANRRPNFVKGNKPVSILASIYQIRHLWAIIKLDPKGLKLAGLRIMTMFREASKID